MKKLWSDMKLQEQENVKRLRELVAVEVRNACFWINGKIIEGKIE
ncbi:hypothetical protein PLANPX_1887 [Lacipirellula parvula]|uniref:Uncharacterized protein n=1 Tax=Lacipirellula parvula TaxID=2650471 RepID=A0A5K7X7C0_9BACT|nr:hypothetical protein PLANPX_1887 [Lacipirellula parvula]